MPYLYGEKILLREYRQEDYTAIRAWVNDRESVRYLSSRYWMPQSAADTADFLDHVTHAGPNGAFFVIADRKTQDYLGQIDLASINWKLRSAELAMVIGNEDIRGRGIGGEALKLMLEYAFGTLALERVELEVAVGNRRAVRCYEKAGFQTEGLKRHAFIVDGAYTDLAVMAILADEWRNTQKS
ncbi:MAG: GNAT family protein [Eubacteriales bacterium]|nr:GNAT family protein [Eubacteriales bacterium]